MLLIFSCGTPITGRTTSCNQLREYFDSIGVSYQVFGRNRNLRYSKDSVKLNLYRWIIEKTSEVAIVDGVFQNYFDRKEVLEEIEHAKSISGVEVYIAAIQHTRSMKFSFDHNEDPGHYPYSSKTITGMNNVYQQPLKIEGIGLVRHVRYNDYLNVNSFMAAINREFDLNYPVQEEQQDDEENDVNTEDVNTSDEYVDTTYATQVDANSYPDCGDISTTTEGVM